jgi:thiol-disulfide isomerase/thioredoxin
MHVRSLLALASLAAVFAFPLYVATAANNPVVTVEPTCPQWQTAAAPGRPLIPPTITIRYNPKSPGARLKSSQAIRVILATAIGFSRFESVTIPMLRSDDGIWQAIFTPKKNYLPGYSIFFFQDEKGQIDNNRTQYWEILSCYRSQVEPFAVEMQALTYEGRLLAPGIQRPPDWARVMEIVKADLNARPLAVWHYPFLWDLERQKSGGTPAAYQQVGNEVDAFLSAHGKDMRAMEQAAGFVAAYQQKLPASIVQKFRAALIALPQTADPFQINAVTKEIIHISRDQFAPRAQMTVTRLLADFDYRSIDSSEADLRKKAGAYLAFAAKYPASLNTSNAYAQAFRCEKEIGDAAATEAVFEKWMALNPPAVQPLLEMAQFYIDRKTESARALELLDAAEKIYAESESPSAHRHFYRQPGKLESLRGQAHLLLKDLPAARADFELALKAAPDNPDIALALGKVCEQMGDHTRALEAYLAAASTPYQKDSAPGDAYERLFVAQRLGSKQDAEERIAAQIAEGTRTAAAGYTPLPLNRPAPEFAFTDLAGNRLDNQVARGKPTVITFWGIWCPPCVAELPAIEQFQKLHPAANTVAVEIGDKPDKIKAFLAALNLNALHVAAQAGWPKEFGVAATPMTIVIDRIGQIQFVHAGLLPNVEAILGKDLSALPEPN